jgi:hypothetical protein
VAILADEATCSPARATTTARCKVIPRTLQQWSQESLRELLDKRYFEPEAFDYKETFPHKSDQSGKDRLRKSICAFANSSGGFLVFGVKDDNALPPADRLIGFDPDVDLPQTFGQYAVSCKPSVTWEYKNPPIVLDSGKVIHVVQIPRSWRGPHGIEVGGGGFIFPKRTNGGDDPMSYEEVRMSFLGYYEKRLKLQLLRSEIASIRSAANDMGVEDQELDRKAHITTFPLTVLEAVLPDGYALLAESSDLLGALAEIRRLCCLCNDWQRSFSPVIHLPLSRLGFLYRDHNLWMRKVLPEIVRHCDRADGLLGGLLA